ncbi:MAG TPA: hypothetical protein VHA55_10990 [Pseudorhodoplanes sp.]|jgi:hypothetical protein|nr:hypothetical protein [Pseudorhodoplanes sp.]
MRPIAVLTACAALLVGALCADKASAQSSQRGYSRNTTVVTVRDEDGRRRTRVIVNRRSYLDGGTEVLPGEKHYQDYANPPYYNVYGVLGPGRDFSQQPLPDSMDLNRLGPRINY